MKLVDVVSHTILPEILPTGAIVVDLGAHAGAFSTFMAEQYSCICHAVEPSPEAFQRIPSHDRIRKYNLAISDSSREVELNIGSHPHATSLYRLANCSYENTITVKARSFGDFIQEAGIERIDLLKIDIEGEELNLFATCSNTILASIDQVTVEFHEWAGLGTQTDVRRILRRMKKLGFYHFSMTRGMYMDVLFVHRRHMTSLRRWLLLSSVWIPRSCRSLLRRLHLVQQSTGVSPS